MMINGLQGHLKNYRQAVSAVRSFVAHEPQVSRQKFGVFALGVFRMGAIVNTAINVFSTAGIFIEI